MNYRYCLATASYIIEGGILVKTTWMCSPPTIEIPDNTSDLDGLDLLGAHGWRFLNVNVNYAGNYIGSRSFFLIQEYK